jgi:hypothetical protein
MEPVSVRIIEGSSIVSGGMVACAVGPEDPILVSMISRTDRIVKPTGPVIEIADKPAHRVVDDPNPVGDAVVLGIHQVEVISDFDR